MRSNRAGSGRRVNDAASSSGTYRRHDWHRHMKQRSDKRRERAAEVKPLRESLIAETGKCMICGANESRPTRGLPPQLSVLACHEILNGPLRNKTLDEPCALLVVCWRCNQELNNKGLWPAARQLSVLLSKAPDRYDLKRFNLLRNPNAPNFVTQEEVDGYLQHERN